MIPLFTNFTNI